MLSCSVMSNSLQPHGLQPTRLLCPWGFSRQEYWSRLPCPPPGDLPNSGIEPRSPTVQADALSSEPPGKPNNTGVGKLFLLQGIFLTQEPNGVSCIAGRFFFCLFVWKRTGKKNFTFLFNISPTVQFRKHFNLVPTCQEFHTLKIKSNFNPIRVFKYK